MNLPKRFTIELTNRCNRACASCPRFQMTVPQGDISGELYTNVLNQLPNNTTVVPFFRGEPTVHPEFPNMLKQLRRFRDVQLATNGDYLTQTVKQAILDNTTFLSFSLHEFKLPYETKWVNFLYDCVGAGVETQVSILKTDLPDNKRKQFMREWSNHVSRIRIYEEHSKNGFGSLTKPSNADACKKPFEDMICYWNGKVGLCNHDWNNSTELGDLNTQSIEQIWNNPHYLSVRAFHGMGMRRMIPSCKSCDFNSNKLIGELVKCR